MLLHVVIETKYIDYQYETYLPDFFPLVIEIQM